MAKRKPSGADATRGERHRPSQEPTLQREVFVTSRLLDFFSAKELTAQTGHGREDWPLALLKELVDNALDACEEARIPPKIVVTVDGNRLEVKDNGRGMSPDIIEQILDYSVRGEQSRSVHCARPRRAGQRTQNGRRDAICGRWPGRTAHDQQPGCAT